MLATRYASRSLFRLFAQWYIDTVRIAHSGKISEAWIGRKWILNESLTLLIIGDLLATHIDTLSPPRAQTVDEPTHFSCSGFVFDILALAFAVFARWFDQVVRVHGVV